MKTTRLTTAQAIVRFLMAQRSVINGAEVPLFAGVFAIFGHGNVTCLGQALEEVKDEFPTWRGQNEQGMALAATAYAKAKRRRQVMVATTSVGPGATNMVTAAGVAMANRLPVLLLSGDTFAGRIPDPVLQQVEHFGSPSTTVNDAFRAVTRYWDRIMAPEQLLQTLPQAVSTLLDPADCGPVFLGLPQDVQAEAFDFPVVFFDRVIHRLERPGVDRHQLAAAAAAIAASEKPIIVAGGGVHYSFAEQELARFAEAHGIPVVETMAGKASIAVHHPLYGGPLGVTGCESANNLAAQADLVLSIGCRLGDFTTGSWTAFRNERAVIIGLNTARFDAVKHRSLALIGDARDGLRDLSAALGDWHAEPSWSRTSATEVAGYHRYIDEIASPIDTAGEPTYAQVVGAVDRSQQPGDYVVAAAGGLPGELNNGWRTDELNSFDCEYGFSCMGYEISGGWGAKMAHPGHEVIVLVGDGSTMMLNSDLYSSVLSGHKMIVIICDNGGFAVINRLQVNQGGVPFNNLIADAKVVEPIHVDFAALAAAQGCLSETVATIDEFEQALGRARAADRTYVISIRTDPHSWTEGGIFWEVGVPEVSDRTAVIAARRELDQHKTDQRIGW